MIELAPERQHLAEGHAVEVIDPETAQPYVALRKDVHDRYDEERRCR